MNKSVLRSEILKKMKGYPEELKKEEEQTLYNQLFDSKEWNESKVIGVTLSLDFEIDTIPIIKRAWQEGKMVSIPRVNILTKQMDFHLIHDFNSLDANKLGILEPVSTLPLVKPEEMELLIVPGVAFDMEGNRIGFGGGFYDRYIPKTSAKTICLAITLQVCEKIHKQPHDCQIQRVITSKKK